MDIFLPGLKLIFSSDSPEIKFNPLGSSLFSIPLTANNTNFSCSFFISETIHTDGLSKVLSGESFEGAEIPYKWTIFRRGNKSGIHIDFDDDPQLREAFCIIDFEENTIDTALLPKQQGRLVSIDPLFQPFGSIIMVVLAHNQNDILIHASGINDKGTGRLFTAVSGTGKSTMAGLWKDAGADVINDDRLWLHKIADQWYIFNTPMPYYAQKPAMVPLNEIFLIRQSSQNEIERLSGVNAAMRFMANGIQHFYDKEMTGRHLDRVFDVASQISIYDCGFMPTGEIVKAIRLLK